MSDHESSKIGRFTGAYASCAQISVLCTSIPHPPALLAHSTPPSVCASYASHLHITSRQAHTAAHHVAHIRITRGNVPDSFHPADVQKIDSF